MRSVRQIRTKGRAVHRSAAKLVAVNRTPLLHLCPLTKADHKHQALPTASVNSNEWKRLWEFKTQCKNFEVTFELSNLSF